MKRSHIFLIVFCLVVALSLPVDAACPKTVKTTPSESTCSKAQVSDCGSSCGSKNCVQNACNSANKKCSKYSEKKGKCWGHWKKSKRSCNNGSHCSTRGCGKNNTIVSHAVVDGDITGTSTFTLCKNNICTVGGNGKILSLTNYNNATDPTFEQLLAFLKTDTTDEKPYTSTYVCSDFAKALHDNAETAGIKAGWVGVRSCNHAFNVFNTTDKGIVYIDCTGVPGGATLQDKQVSYKVGQPLVGTYLFRDGSINMGCSAGSALVYW